MAGKSTLIALVLSLYCYHGEAARLNEQCNSSKDCGRNQACVASRCSCVQGATRWAGSECVVKRVYGEYCDSQIECTMSGDPNLHCMSSDGQGKSQCLCSDAYVPKASNNHRCRPLNHPRNEDDGGWKSVKKMQPKPNGDGVISLQEHDKSDIFNKSSPKKKHTDAIWAPAVVVCMMAIIILLCCCFLRIDPNAPHSFDKTEEEQQQEQQNKKKRKEQEDDDGFFDVELSNSGHDNPTYQNDEEEDTVSRFTTTTEICDANHAAIIAEQNSKEERPKSANSRTKIRTNPHTSGSSVHKKAKKAKKDDKKKKEEADINANHEKKAQEEEVKKQSESRSMEKKSSIDSVESQISNSTIEEDIKTRRTIERIETPDTTSIDTTVPQEEVVIDAKALAQIKAASDQAAPNERFIY